MIMETRSSQPPLHFIWNIEHFSLLPKSGSDFSGIFTASGFKWRLRIHANGNKDDNGKGYVSLYLVMVGSGTGYLTKGWQVSTNFKLSLLDQNHGIYWSLHESKLFNERNDKWGLPKFISLASFHNPSNGYLVNDSCTFGAEVTALDESVGTHKENLVLHQPYFGEYRWKIENYSKLRVSFLHSRIFTAGDYKWEILFYPVGISEVEGKYLTVSLGLSNTSDLPSEQSLYVDFGVWTFNQINGEHTYRRGAML